MGIRRRTGVIKKNSENKAFMKNREYRYKFTRDQVSTKSVESVAKIVFFERYISKNLPNGELKLLARTHHNCMTKKLQRKMLPSLGSFIMGCIGSRHEDRANTTTSHEEATTTPARTANSNVVSFKEETANEAGVNLQPKVSMMADHTLKLLREIGELKTFTEIDPTDVNLNKFSDFIMALENPQAAVNNAKNHANK
ncbi:uncharacterized protein LOC124459582 [Xenia sp. Carnegie-2017]|uniref:uncharacterized protein LOC124459582 n=1 Tax=Xenia sp. Carnegie-2017 TaxID=2897299 RepID=UPI001F03E98B|nr:uncharacterized protein LOC124459582 [Xenia sp. Carnegie-2017]